MKSVLFLLLFILCSCAVQKSEYFLIVSEQPTKGKILPGKSYSSIEHIADSLAQDFKTKIIETNGNLIYYVEHKNSK